MGKLFVTSISFVIMSVFLIGCKIATEDDASSQKMLIQNDASVLVNRVTYSNTPIEILPVSDAISEKPAMAPKDPSVTLTLVAEVASPSIDAVTLQASEISIHGSKAYVTYNKSGEVYLGAIEIYDISDTSSPSLVSSATFSDTDINAVTVHGSDLYLAAASSDVNLASPSLLKHIALSGGLLTDTVVDVDLSSYSATSVTTKGSSIYVTVGAASGAIIEIDQSDFASQTKYDIDDARDITTDGSDLAVIAGTNGVDGASAKLLTFNGDISSNTGSFDVSGASIEFSKSTIEIVKDMAVLATGDGGTQIVCLTDGALLKQIANPVVAGLSDSLTVANAATADRRSLFMANGEAGVYVAVADSNLNSASCDVDDLSVLGKLELNDYLLDDEGNHQSVNHIVYKSGVLFVAAGLGGIKIISVDD